MNIIVKIIIILFIVSILFSIVYIIYMGNKKSQYPNLDFSRFKDGKNDINSIQLLANKSIKGVNGWLFLSTTFMALYYFMNFWSIAFMLLNLVVVIYEINYYKDLLILLVSGSLFFTCLELWINSKEKSIKFHKQWFNTSIITKDYIVKFSLAKDYEELCKLVKEYNRFIYDENEKIDFF